MVRSFQPKDDVLPVTVDGQARLVVGPRQEVVVAAVEHGVGRLGGRDSRKQLLVQLVAIVTDAYFERYRRVHDTDHRRLEECRIQSELATPQELLAAENSTDLLSIKYHLSILLSSIKEALLSAIHRQA